MTTTIAVVCGGVGAARFLRALSSVWPAEHTIGVVNTGDDTVLHGLSISPDLDTITYTLADAIDPERGWGMRDETWRAMQALQRFVPVRPGRRRPRPPGSTSATRIWPPTSTAPPDWPRGPHSPRSPPRSAGRSDCARSWCR